MLNMSKCPRIIETTDITLEDNKNIINIKKEEDFEWLITTFAPRAIFKLSSTYFLLTIEDIYVFSEEVFKK